MVPAASQRPVGSDSALKVCGRSNVTPSKRRVSRNGTRNSDGRRVAIRSASPAEENVMFDGGSGSCAAHTSGPAVRVFTNADHARLAERWNAGPASRLALTALAAWSRASSNRPAASSLSAAFACMRAIRWCSSARDSSMRRFSR